MVNTTHGAGLEKHGESVCKHLHVSRAFSGHPKACDTESFHSTNPAENVFFIHEYAHMYCIVS